MLVFGVYIFVIFVLYISFVTIFVCRVTLYYNSTMAEANGIRDLPKQGVQSILEGFSIDDSERSLPQVPNETLGRSSVSQTLSSSFNRLQRGITNRIGKHTSQPQHQTSNEIDADQLSPTSLRTHSTAYQATVRTLHEQNDHNAELLGHLEAAVREKDAEISRLRNEEMEKDLRLQAQHRDFQAQLSAEQTAREQVTNTLELMRQELEALKEAQNGPNPMDFSVTDNTDLIREHDKAEQEKGKLAEELERTKTDYEQALASKNLEVSLEIERIKKHMEEQMRKERVEATRTSKHQLQSIMSELRSLKDKHEKDTKARKVEEKTLLENIKASIDPVLKLDHKTSDQIGVGARLKHLQEEVTNYLPPTVNKKRGAAITTDDTFGDLTLGGYRDAKHVHFASTPIRPEISNISLTPPRTHKEETIVELVLHNTMQTLASEFKRTREPKIQKFRGGTSSGALLVFKSWMQDIECAIKDRNLNNEEVLQLVKEFSEGCARDNINFYLEVTDSPSVDGLFENLRQVFSSGEDGQQMLAKFYSCVQNQKESVKEFGESLLQIARKIMTTKPEFKVDINNTLKARFADSLRDHYQAMAREMIRSRPTLSYVAYKSEVLKTLGPNVKPRSITTSKLETSDIESPPKKRKRESELDQKINAAIEENRKLSERLSAFDPKTITDTVINAVQGNYQSSKPAGFAPKQFKPSQFYGKPREPQLVPGTDGSLKPEIDCNYCKDLGHLKYNCLKLKEKEARMAGQWDYNKSKKEN